jgi:hypothetical protein
MSDMQVDPPAAPSNGHTSRALEGVNAASTVEISNKVDTTDLSTNGPPVKITNGSSSAYSSADEMNNGADVTMRDSRLDALDLKRPK